MIVGKNGRREINPPKYDIEVHVVREKMCSELPSEALYFADIFDDDKVLDGISIKSDYIGKVSSISYSKLK